MIPNSKKKYKDQYLAYWLKKQEKSMNNRVFIERHRFSRNTYPFHKIQIVGKPSTYHKNKISHKEMIKYYPYWNTIYILHTSRGVITSKEAFDYKLGGFIICKITL
jgi:ribosomal protein S8